MKKIYLVRHGESEGNVARIVGGKDFALTAIGLEQAEVVAKRVAHLGITQVVSSDFVRAQETVQIIANTLKLEPETVTAFGEKLAPSSFYGLPDDAPQELAYVREGNERMCDPSYRFEDGENFFDVHARVNQARAYLEDSEHECMLVVSHGFFLSYFIAALLLDEPEPSRAVLDLSLKLKLSNGGVTSFQLKDGVWKLHILNDHAYFAE